MFYLSMFVFVSSFFIFRMTQNFVGNNLKLKWQRTRQTKQEPYLENITDCNHIKSLAVTLRAQTKLPT